VDPPQPVGGEPDLAASPESGEVTPSGKAENGEVGAVYLTRAEIARRVGELGVEISRDYAELDPILVAPLKSSVVFLADLTRRLTVSHTLDVVEIAPYTDGRDGGVRLLKDIDAPLAGRHVLVVEDVVDTGLTLHFLCNTLALRDPASLAAVTLLDRPYRRLVEQLPLSYVGFTVPDELFAGYGLGLEERWRALPDLHVVSSVALPRAATEAA
jgi:hypoxanthine phosphoribosyltransferase